LLVVAKLNMLTLSSATTSPPSQPTVAAVATVVAVGTQTNEK
jgi:hypothetical protein